MREIVYDFLADFFSSWYSTFLDRRLAIPRILVS